MGRRGVSGKSIERSISLAARVFISIAWKGWAISSSWRSVLGGDEPAELGIAEAHALMTALGIATEDLVAGAYVDLLAAARDERAREGPAAG